MHVYIDVHPCFAMCQNFRYLLLFSDLCACSPAPVDAAKNFLNAKHITFIMLSSVYFLVVLCPCFPWAALALGPGPMGRHQRRLKGNRPPAQPTKGMEMHIQYSCAFFCLLLLQSFRVQMILLCKIHWQGLASNFWVGPSTLFFQSCHRLYLPPSSNIHYSVECGIFQVLPHSDRMYSACCM